MPRASDEILGRRVKHDVDLPGRVSVTASTIEPRKTFGADPGTEKILDGSLDSFAPETSSFVRPLKRVRGAVAGLPSLFGPSLAIRIRDHLDQKSVVGAAAVACVLLGLVMVGRMLSGSETVSTPAVSATSLGDKQASEAVDHVSSNGGDAKGRLSPVQARTTAGERRPTAAGDRRRPDGNSNGSAIATRTSAQPTARAAAQSEAGPTETAPAPEPAIAVAPDLVVYSDEDRDVQPPKVLSSELPRPTFAGWTTRSNSMELIISENGTVEHVRLLTPPQRMPDMMLLSRAKMWKFGPAEKGGRPVRYRLVLKWEVNP